ncbi:hypothetical protein U1Q18_037517, partial [Sarracenia purpurea var. burkii]
GLVSSVVLLGCSLYFVVFHLDRSMLLKEFKPLVLLMFAAVYDKANADIANDRASEM